MINLGFQHRKLVEQAIGEGRVLLTKDMKLLERRLMPDNLAYYVRKSGKWEQLAEVYTIKKNLGSSWIT